MGLNLFPELPDKFYPTLYASPSSSPRSDSGSDSSPPMPEGGGAEGEGEIEDPSEADENPSASEPSPPSPETTNPKAHESYYLQHCLPTIPQIVSKLHTLRAARPSLRRVYVLSNGWGWWLDSLKRALQQDGWDDLKSSLDVRLDGEQAYVAMAVAMAVAEKAEVFGGNGVSSLISIILSSLSSPPLPLSPLSLLSYPLLVPPPQRTESR